MPVFKYRSVADMPPPPLASEVDLVARIRNAWNRAFLLCPPMVPRGVQRFASIQAANEAREKVTVERMRRTEPRR